MWVKLDPTMKVEDMNYTQLHRERYRLRHKIWPGLGDKVAEALADFLFAHRAHSLTT